MRLSTKQTKVFANDYDRLFRFAAEEGCAAVQIHLPDADALPRIQAAMRTYAVAVASVSAMSTHMLGPDRVRQAHEHRQVERALVIADKLGAPCVSNFAGGDPGLDLAGNAAEFARVYAPHAQVAERLGLKICFENCPMLGGTPPVARNIAWNPQAWQAMFTACDSPALALELDVSHPVWCGFDPGALLREWHQRIGHVQIKDVRIEGGTHDGQKRGLHVPHRYVPLGEGDLDGEAVFAALRDIAYRGFLTADIEGDDLDAIRRNLAAMRRMMAQADQGASNRM